MSKTPADKPKQIRPLTGKQKIFVREVIDNPTQPIYKSAKNAGYKGNDNVLRSMASENMTKPNIMLELAKHSQTAELVLLEVLEQSRTEMKLGKSRSVDWANTARQTADSLLDRVHGKATQRVEQTSQAVQINIDLTGTVSDTTDSKAV